MILMPPDMAPAGGWPVTVSGWITLAGVSITTIVLIWDRLVSKGRRETKIADQIEAICRDIEDINARLTVVDGLTKTVQELVFEWRGIDGKNGWRSVIKNYERRIGAIERRNDRLDAIRVEDERRSGGQHRRRIDRELDNLRDDAEENT